MRIVLVGDAQSQNTHGFLAPLVGAGHDVHLVSLHRAIVPVDGVAVHYLSNQRQLSKARYALKALSARRLIRGIAPDLVIGYRVTGNGLLAALAGVRPFLAVPTGTDVLGLERRTPALRSVVRFVLRGADAVLCWAPHMARAVASLAPRRTFVLAPGPFTGSLCDDRRLGSDPALTNPRRGGVPLLVQPRGVDRARFAPRPLPRGAPGATTIVSTRRLKRSYRHDLLIRSLALLPPSRAWRLLLAGEGSDEARLRGLVAECGVVERVSFLGPVPAHQVRDVLSAGAVYASLIDHDGVSASLLEAMSVGLYPVVGASEAASLWIEDGRNGRLVASTDPGELAAVFDAVFDDPAASAVVERNQRLAGERADAAVNGARIEAFVRELAGARVSIRNSRRVGLPMRPAVRS